jgi:hypothetical protein
MKILLMLIGCLTANLCFAQVGDPYHSWNFSYGRTGTPGDQLKIGLEYAKADKTAFITEAGVELSRYKDIRYSCISLGITGRYYLVGNTYMTSKKKINVMAGMGGVLQLENERSVYKTLDIGKRMNYGVNGQLVGEYFYDPTIGFFLEGEQKVLFNETLGKYNYSISVGIRIHFGNNQ